MNLSTWQKRLFAWGMAKANEADASRIRLTGYPGYANLADLKTALLGHLRGKILEIGPGAGVNFAYYPKDIDWIGVEPNPFMFSHLLEEAKHQGFTSLELREGMAEKLPLENNSIDTVVCTHVLCSVQDIQISLQEIYRVLKPKGNFIFIEHIAAECGTCKRKLQNGIQPLWKTVFDNCHPNRETEKFLEGIGFETLNYQKFAISFPIVSPHLAGCARKSA